MRSPVGVHFSSTAERDHQHQHRADGEDVLIGEQRRAADRVGLRAERGGKSRLAVAVDHADDRFDQDQQPTPMTMVFSGGIVARPGGTRSRSTKAPRTSPPTSAAAKPIQYEPVALRDRDRDVGGGRRHRALREVQHPRGAPDEDEGQRDRGVHRAERQSVEGQEQERLIGLSEPQVGVSELSSACRSAAGCRAATTRPRREHDRLVGDRQRAAYVLFDEQHGRGRRCRAGPQQTP